MKFLTPILLIGISIGLFFLYLNPAYSKIREVQGSLNQYNDAINRTKAASQRRDELLNKYNSFSPDQLSRLQTLLPDKIDNVRLLVDINAIASQYAQGISDIKISTIDEANSGTIGSSTNSPYGTLTLTFNTKMSYADFQKFLHDLENSLRIIDVSSVSFASGANSSTDTSNYTVSLKTYWLR